MESTFFSRQNTIFCVSEISKRRIVTVDTFKIFALEEKKSDPLKPREVASRWCRRKRSVVIEMLLTEEIETEALEKCLKEMEECIGQYHAKKTREELVGNIGKV